MWKDPIVEEIRNIREQHAARFNDDLTLIAKDMLKNQELAKQQGRKFASYPPLRPQGWALTAVAEPRTV